MMQAIKALPKKLKSVDYLSLLAKGYNDLVKEPFYILLHPIKGFYEFKAEKLGKTYVAVTYLILMIITRILEYNNTGFLVNPNNPNDFNAFRIILMVLLPVVLLTVGNWSITCLFDGKGKMKEIFMVVGYAFVPYVFIMIPTIIYSNFLIIDEVAFYQAFVSLAVFLLGFKLFFGLLGVHEYGLLKTGVTLVFTALAVGVIIFISFLFLTLFQQVYAFIYSVLTEFAMRYL